MNKTMCLLPIGVSTLILAVLARDLPALDYAIENDAMTRVVSVDTTVATTALSNKLTGRTYKVTSDEFKVVRRSTMGRSASGKQSRCRPCMTTWPVRRLQP